MAPEPQEPLSLDEELEVERLRRENDVLRSTIERLRKEMEQLGDTQRKLIEAHTRLEDTFRRLMGKESNQDGIRSS